jgi:acetoin utilization deacetylase AcuC-like enzyme
MQVVYAPQHRQHRPSREIWNGIPRPHVDVPERAEVIRDALLTEGFDVVEPVEHGIAPVEAVHDPGMVRFLAEAWRDWAAAGNGEELVPDTVLHPALREGMGPAPEPSDIVGRIGYWCFETMTPVGPGTYPAARAAADVALTAADLVVSGARASYALCRPPGHHAARGTFGGYCYLNNAAVAAEHLIGATGGPVAVLDLDYHHGNGTQQIFYQRSDVLYVSIHADPNRAYPHVAGFPEERGGGHGRGATVNIPLPPGIDDPAYLAAVDQALEAVTGHDASVTVLSLGFDGYRDDPICDFDLSAEVYGEIARRVGDAADRLLIVQEGGYAVEALADLARRFLTGVLG